MALDSKHPSYTARYADWLLMRDCYEGEKAVKAKGREYLPPTPGMLIDGMGYNGAKPKLGQENYDAYKQRAVFHDYVKEAVKHFVGLMHYKPATIKVPKAMEPLLQNATVQNESLQQLLMRINEQQLLPGRVGIFVDLPASVDGAGTALPYLALYHAETITNWDESDDKDGHNKLNFVVLDETTQVRKQQFEWESEDRYRVLMLSTNLAGVADGTYVQASFIDTKQFDPGELTAPLYRGRSLPYIPFVTVNPNDVTMQPDAPPLLGLANLCMTIYRGEADYRHNLFMQGQDTLVIIGGKAPSGPYSEDDATRVGAGAKIECDIHGDAKFIGVSAHGLSEQRIAVENDCKKAENKAGELISPGKTNQESGEALKTRLSATNATLTRTAQTGAFGLELALKMIAEWIGANPDEVSVQPNLEFGEVVHDVDRILKMQTAKKLGAPLAQQTIHDRMREQGITKLELKEELALIDSEVELAVPDPTDDDDDNNRGA